MTIKDDSTKSSGKRPVARRRKHGMSPRKMKAAAVFAETGSKKAAAEAVGVDPRNSTRFLDSQEAYQEVQRCLLEQGVGPAKIAEVTARLTRATKFINDTAADYALRAARDSRRRQLMLFDPVSMMPRENTLGVVADLSAQKSGVELAAKFFRMNDQDPEYGKRMFEQGQEAAGHHYLALIEALRGHLTPEGQRVLAERVSAMGDGGKR
jgi:hypothetical protein